MEDRVGHHGRDDPDEGGRPPGAEPTDREDQSQGAECDPQSVEVNVVDALDEGGHLLEQRVPVDRDPRHLAQLAHDHEHCGAGEIAHQQGLRQEVGDHAQPEDTADEAPQADDDRQR